MLNLATFWWCWHEI